MALGGNLKKQKLIPDQAKEVKSVPEETPEKVVKKKLISKDKQRRERKSLSSFTSSLFHYLTEQTVAHRAAVREKYQQEILALSGKQVQLILFDAGNEVFAIDISAVREVISTPAIAKVPGMPGYLKGMIKLRKQTLMVMDLSEKLRISTADDFPFTLILRSTKQPLGLLLRDLPRTLKVDGGKITGSLQSLERTSRDEIFVKGLVTVGDKLVFYLDIEELVNSDKAMVIPDELLKDE